MSVDDLKKQVIREQCERDHLFFTRYFFKKRTETKFIVNWHHYLMAEALQRVLEGKCRNLILNLPPGGTKTELAVINFMAHGLAINPNARFLHISSSEDLVLLNSQTARDTVQGDDFQELWPMLIADDAKAKKRWNVVLDGRKRGGVYAVSLGGQITGFRAGHMAPGFQGAINIDDPLKADDAYSSTAIKTANRQLLGTVKSRKANPETAIVLTMQRLSEFDCSGFIEGGNLPGKWETCIIPALITDEYVSRLPAYIAEKVEIAERDKDGRFSYWPYKEPLDELLQLEAGRGKDSDGNRISRHVFAAQYMQRPQALGGNIIHGNWFPRIKLPPKILYRNIYADTAQKTAERNDYSVFECWGYGEDGRIYLLDLLRGKWEAPDLKRTAIEFWNKHSSLVGFGTLREMKVEDKSSGTGLIQELKNSRGIPVKGIPRDRDKLVRVMDALPHVEAGFVVLLEDAHYVSDFIQECEAFTADDTHPFDDQIDPMCDAVSDMLATKPKGIMDVLEAE